MHELILQQFMKNLPLEIFTLLLHTCTRVHTHMYTQRMFVSAGGVFLDEHPVTQILPGPVITIRTSRGTFRTRRLVITAGAWAPALLRTLGVELPLQVGRAVSPMWGQL